MSDALLELFQEMIDHDQGYRQRLERHYKMEGNRRRSVTSWAEEAEEDSVDRAAGIRIFASRQPVRRQGPKTDPIASCPCGSGRKYKNCCRT